MEISARKVQSIIARCLYIFLLDGTMKAYGVILEATVRSFETEHALIGPVFSLQTSIGYLVVPLVRLLEGSISPRLVAILGGVLATAGLLCRSLIPLTSVWYLVMFLSVSGIGFGLVNFVTLIGLKESFGEGFPSAYTISSFPSYIGIATLPPLMGYLLRIYGQQGGLFVFGMITCLLIITGLFTPSHDVPPSDSSPGLVDEKISLDDSANGDEASNEREHLVDKTGISDNFLEHYEETKYNGYWLSLFTQHPAFVCLLLISGLNCFEYISWSIYLVPYGEDLGLDSSTAVWLSTAGGLSGILGKVFCLIIFQWDKLVLPVGLIMSSIFLDIAYSVSIFVDDFNALVFMASLSGFSLSVTQCVCMGWLPKTVCSSHFKGAIAFGYSVAGTMMVLGALITGAVVDIASHYRPAFVMLIALNSASTVVSTIWYDLVLLQIHSHRRIRSSDQLHSGQ